MAASKVLIELEVQTEGFKAQLEAGVLNPLEGVSAQAKKVATTVSDSMQNAANNVSKAFAGQQVSAALNTIGQDVDKLRAKLEALEKEEKGILSAMKGLGAGATKQLQTELEKVQKEAKDVKQALAGMGAGAGMEKASAGASVMAKEFKNAKSELKELSNLISSGQLSGEPLQAAVKRAAELKDNIGDTNQLINSLASDTRGIDAVVTGAQAIAAAFAVTSGIIGAFTEDQEKAEEATRKVQSAISILLGVQELARILTDKNALSIKGMTVAQLASNTATNLTTAAMTRLGIAATTTSIGFKVLRTAIMTTGIGAIVAGLGYLISKLMDSGEKASELGDKVSTLSKELRSNVASSAASAASAFEKLIDVQLKLAEAQGAISETDANIQAAQLAYSRERLKSNEAHKAQLDEIKEKVKELETAYKNAEVGSKERAEAAKAYTQAKYQAADAERKITAQFNAEQAANEQAHQDEITLIRVNAGKERAKKLADLEGQYQDSLLAAEKARIDLLVSASKEGSEEQLNARKAQLAFELKLSEAALDKEKKTRLSALKEVGITEGKQVQAVHDEVTAKRLLAESETYKKIEVLTNDFYDKQRQAAEQFNADVAEIEKQRLESLASVQAETAEIMKGIDERSKIAATPEGSLKRMQVENEIIKKNASEQTAAIDAELQRRAEIRSQKNLEITEQEAAEEANLAAKRVQINYDADEQIKENRKSAEQEMLANALSGFDSLQQSLMQISNTRLQSQIEGLEAEKEAQLRNTELTAAQRQRIEERTQNEIKKARLKQAQNDKAAALFSAGINVAKAITEVLGKSPFLIALVAAAGAAQIAAIASQPLPKFEKGGLVGGRLHRDGGTLIEAERGEMIISRRRTEQHKELATALNTSDTSLRRVINERYVQPIMLGKALSSGREKDKAFRFSTKAVESELRSLNHRSGKDTDRLIAAIKESKIESKRNIW